MPDQEENEEATPKQESEILSNRLLESRTILLTETIDKELAEEVVSKLLLLDQEDEEETIYLYINSPGGDVDAGFAIYDVARFISAPVVCIAAGLTASAAVVVLLAAEKDRRVALPNSRFLLHQPSTGVQGTTADIQIEANQILKIRQKINELIADGTGQPLEQVEKDTHRNFWMDSDEALEYGLIGDVVTSKADLQK
jgi:ATP-dependent Clp protease protease subunit